MANTTPSTIGFIGGGNMAASLIGGMLNNGFSPQQIYVSDPLEQNRLQFSKLGVQTSDDNRIVAGKSDILVLAVKPQIMADVACGLSETLQHNALVISIAAGIPVAALQNWLGDKTAIVRCMPNTPALLQAGASGLFATADVTDNQRALAEQILSAVGIVEWVATEELIDVVTAVSGSGPAYFFLFMEYMEKIGTEMGLPVHVAKNLTVQTALGAARMADQQDVDLAELRRRVTSPAGTTERAINTFIHDGLENLFRHAMEDCKLRAEEMATEFTATDREH